MKILHSDQGVFEGGNSIFLAGPTPRNSNTQSWRPNAVQILKKYNFSGTVLIPERTDWSVQFDYLDQAEWELDSLEKASRIVFWVPRDMSNMPALTTNVEFGYWLAKTPSKILYGRPDNAPSTRYLDFLYSKHCSNLTFNSLEELLRNTVWDFLF